MRSIYKATIVFIVLVIVISGLSACSLLPKEEETLAPPLVEPVKMEYNLYEVKKDTISTELKGTGTFVSTKDYLLSFENVSGRLKSINVNLGQDVKKGDIVAELNAGDLETRIQQQELAVKKSRLALEQKNLQLKKDEQSGADSYTIEKDKNDISMAQLDVDSAELQLNSLKASLNEMKLVAPVAGKVVYVAKAKVGDQISAFQVLVQIADPSSLQLSCDTSDASKFEVGMKAEVKIGNDVYEGTVVATPASVAPELKEQMQNKIYLEVKDLPSTVKMGDSASFTVVTAKKENVLVVPRSAIKNYMGNDYVEVLENGSKKECYIQKGLETPTMVEVLDGLKEGDKVILR